MPDHRVVDLGLSPNPLLPVLAHRDPLGRWSKVASQLRVYQSIGQNHIGAAEELDRAERHQPRVAGTRTHQVNMPGYIGTTQETLAFSQERWMESKKPWANPGPFAKRCRFFAQ